MADWQTLSDRINHVAPSATLAVDSKAKAMKAAGIDVIGFGAGEPNFPTPAPIVAAAAAAARRDLLRLKRGRVRREGDMVLPFGWVVSAGFRWFQIFFWVSRHENGNCVS